MMPYDALEMQVRNQSTSFAELIELVYCLILIKLRYVTNKCIT